MRRLVSIPLALAASATLLAQARPQPGVRLPLDQISAQMFHVSAGKRLKPKAWPNGARVAVGLSFDVDNATADLATGNLISESISRGEYGAVDGVPRILRLLDKHQLPASFFIPAVSHLLHPDMIPLIMKSGRHEIGVHGWIHEHLPSALHDQRNHVGVEEVADSRNKEGRAHQGNRQEAGRLPGAVVAVQSLDRRPGEG